MLERIVYSYTPGGQMKVLDSTGQQLDFSSLSVLGVLAQDASGVFEVKWKGGKIEPGCSLLLPVKGSKQISLKMDVVKVDSLITPVGSWSAVCNGPKFKEFKLKNIEAKCDQCGSAYTLEFIAYSDDDQQDALAAMNLCGWQADSDKQYCPGCLTMNGDLK